MNEYFIKIIVFVICGIVGSLGSLANKTDNSNFKKDTILSIIFAVIAGIVTLRFLIDELEVAGVIATVCGIFASDISKEIKEILDQASNIITDTAKKKIDDKLGKDKGTKDEISKNSH